MFRELPVVKRLKVFDTILEFHEFVAEKGYIAVDFYDGSIISYASS